MLLFNIVIIPFKLRILITNFITIFIVKYNNTKLTNPYIYRQIYDQIITLSQHRGVSR